MSDSNYPPADFKFPPGFTFPDQGTEREESARRLLYFLLFDPAVQQTDDDMVDETYEADMKELAWLENNGFFDESLDEHSDAYDRYGDDL